jgi:hypothetical protein
MLETPHSFVNAMEGAALRRRRELDLGVYTAWHAATFAVGMYGGKLKGKKLSDFLSEDSRPARSKAAEALSFFHTLKARGVAVDITRVN